MVVGITRVLAAVVVMLILLVDVQPGTCGSPSLLSPVNSLSRTVTTTTTKVVKTSVATLNTAVAAPFKVLNSVGNAVGNTVIVKKRK